MQDASYKERAQKLKHEFMHILSRVPKLSKLHIVETMTKLGLSNVLHKEIKDALDSIASKLNNDAGLFEDDLLDTALSFRLLRQQGYNVPQGHPLITFKFNSTHYLRSDSAMSFILIVNSI